MSLKKIAEMSGVSVSTVSRVLNNPNYSSSSEELRDRIWKAAREINYIPNMEARNLKKGIRQEQNGRMQIDILMTRTDEQTSDTFFMELLHVIESEIHRNNCIFNRVWYRPVFSDDRQIAKLDVGHMIDEMLEETDDRSDGIVIIGKCCTNVLLCLQKHCGNIVSVNRNSTNYLVDEVVCDGAKLAYKAVEHLVSLGHKRIGYVGECTNEVRYRGYLDALMDYHLELQGNYVFETRQTEEAGYEAMKQLSRETDAPTGIYCANDVLALGMLNYIKHTRREIEIPSIISSDGIDRAQRFVPQLTTVKIPKEDMGRLAIHLLLDRIRDGHSSIARIELNGNLLDGETCRKYNEL